VMAELSTEDRTADDLTVSEIRTAQLAVTAMRGEIRAFRDLMKDGRGGPPSGGAPHLTSAVEENRVVSI